MRLGFKQWKPKIRFTTLRAKVLSFTLILLCGLLIGYGSVLFVTNDLSENFDALFKRSLQLTELEDTMRAMEGHVRHYLESKDSDSFIGYMSERQKLLNLSEAMTQGLSQDEAKLRLHNLGTMVPAYLETAEQAIQYKRARNIPATLERHNRLMVLSSYLGEGIQSLQRMDFNQNLDRYVAMTDQLRIIKGLLLGIFMVLLLLGMVFVVDFTQRISEPIEALSQHALTLSQGHYDIQVTQDFGYDEARVLSEAFAQMATSMALAIEELKDKAQTQTQLRLSAVENLRMQNLLKQAELMALQSQINPHFLFNTINAGLQLAILEDADQTAIFLDHMARMFRYNIQRLDNVVTFADELENLKHYYHLMKVRFQDMLEMDFDIDSNCLSLGMPPMILQPIVENALVHGLKHKETPGHIAIGAKVVTDASGLIKIRITVADDGSGMDEDKLKRLVDSAYRQGATLGHTTGLGLSNVYERLRVFFETESILEVRSQLGQGTQVILSLPMHTELEDGHEALGDR